MHKPIAFIAFVGIVILICSPALAQETSKDWQFDLAPLYLWGISIDGTQTVKGQEVDLEAGFSDIFNNLNGVFTAHFEAAWKEKWGGFTDINWVNLEADTQSSTGSTITPKYTTFFFELAGFYRLTKDDHDFDFLAGIRYTAMDLKLESTGPLPTQTGEQDWVDPIVGLRWFWHFTDKWELWLEGDIGGFGVGSDFTWNAVGMIYYQPWKHVGFFGGYRALYQDYEDGSGSEKFAFDATMHGPLLGLNITW